MRLINPKQFMWEYRTRVLHALHGMPEAILAMAKEDPAYERDFLTTIEKARIDLAMKGDIPMSEQWKETGKL